MRYETAAVLLDGSANAAPANCKCTGTAMRILTATLLALALPATGAGAQQPPPQYQPPPTSAFGSSPVMRITVPFRTAVEAADAHAVPDQKAQETARRALYDMAAGECVVLSEAFQAECRLGSLQIFTQVAPAQPANAPPSMNATVVFELRPRSAASAR
jgi:mannose/cellobiose epimerase-like protein (N-acyl-D-glucosamine 2-epimerase family)